MCSSVTAKQLFRPFFVKQRAALQVHHTQKAAFYRLISGAKSLAEGYSGRSSSFSKLCQTFWTRLRRRADRSLFDCAPSLYHSFNFIASTSLFRRFTFSFPLTRLLALFPFSRSVCHSLFKAKSHSIFPDAALKKYFSLLHHTHFLIALFVLTYRLFYLNYYRYIVIL